MTNEELKDYNDISDRMHHAERIVREINNELFGQGFKISGWHLNGDLESLDTWFEDNDWTLVEDD